MLVHLLFICSLCLAQCQDDGYDYFDDTDYENGINFNSTDNTWGWRTLTVGMWNLGLWSGGWFNSIQVETGTKQPVVNGDYMWGSVYAGTGASPLSYFGYFGKSATYERNISNPGGIDWSTFNVTTTSAFIASAFISVTENSTTTGTVFQLPLKSMIWTYNLSASSGLTNATAGIYAMVFDGSRPLSGWPNIQVQYILTERAGVVGVMNGVKVYPRAIESIFIIQGWQYQNAANFLSLQTAVGSSKGIWNQVGQIVSGDGDGKTYFNFANTALVDGRSQPAAIGAKIVTTPAIAFDNGPVVAQLNSRYQGSVSCEVVTVSFPPGAAYIAYDPTMGSGPSPYDPASAPPSTYTVIVVIVSVFLGVLVVSLIITAIYMKACKKAEYNRVPNSV